MRVLVLCGDYWHPGHVARQGLGPLVQAGFSFDWSEDPREWSVEVMHSYPLVVFARANEGASDERRPWMTGEIELAFKEYVRKGNGLLVIHSGSASYAKFPVLTALLGGAFTHHPAQCQVTLEPQGSHPLAAGVSPFTVFDEHYFMDREPDTEVFMASRSEHGVQPAGWTRREGQGRVCLLTPGHNLEVWLHPAYQALLQKAFHWTAQTENAR
jgi:type 1 glutamine amidotransferase